MDDWKLQATPNRVDQMGIFQVCAYVARVALHSLLFLPVLRFHIPSLASFAFPVLVVSFSNKIWKPLL
jgi:hypothetical protein